MPMMVLMTEEDSPVAVMEIFSLPLLYKTSTSYDAAK